MCGIAGLFHFGQQQADASRIKTMTDRIGHRGPDSDGFYVNGPVALGHRRLSIIDLSERSNQPLFDSTGRFAIIFNGEIYNYKEVKSLLGEYPFQTTGDTEVVLAAYQKWGAASLHYLKGMFAFAIADKQTGELFITRDRLGVKPLYYYKDSNVFVFASEIRSILASGLVKREICQEALIDYFSYQSFQSPQTIIKNILELPSGCYIRLSNADFQITNYWNVFDNHGEFGQVDRYEVQKRVKQLLLQSVERRMVSDVPVAAFLSGGIDSSAMVGLMAEVSQAPETFNIAFEEKEFDESEYASLIARKFNTRHHKVLIKPEVFLEELPNALNAMDTPSGDGINTYVVSKAIRQHGIKVALSGVGGDELFVGYPIFRQWETLYRRKGFWKTPQVLRNMISTVFAGNDIRKQRKAQLIRMDECSIAHTYPVLRQVNSDETISKLLRTTVTKTQLFKKLEANQEAIEQFPLLSQLSIAEYMGYTNQTLLKDTDQMSMAHSLEVREPFFDHELIEYVLRVPDEYKKGEVPKSLLIESLGDLIPPTIYNRPKKGFVFPWNQWLRNELKNYCETRIKTLSQREFIHQTAMMNYWEDFLNHRNAVGYSNILMLVSLENYIELHGLG